MGTKFSNTKATTPLRMISMTALAAVILFAVSCSGGEKPRPGGDSDAVTTGNAVAGYPTCPPTGSASQLTGAGATFPFPLYSQWVSEYQKLCSVRINYQSIGSGGGIRQITEKTVDFGASDGIMTDQQETAAIAASGPILHIPMTSGAVAVVYNLPGVQRGQLKLTPDVLADIYLKKITKWNDQRIAAANSGLSLPNADIAVVHRSDGSGTTFIFTNYLSKVSADWKDRVGFGTSVNWPGDIGGQGNEGVSGQVRQIVGAIGYVELAYAKQTNLAWAQLRNKAGSFVEPTLDATTAAADGVDLPDNTKVLITDSANAKAYPISGFTWVLAYTNQPDAAKGRALAHYLWWAIHDGQKLASPLDYAPLSSGAVQKAEALVLALRCGGSPCLEKTPQ